jgi:hypothetical protein
MMAPFRNRQRLQDYIRNYVIKCLARLEFCNSLYPKELAVFFPSYFVDHLPIELFRTHGNVYGDTAFLDAGRYKEPPRGKPKQTCLPVS